VRSSPDHPRSPDLARGPPVSLTVVSAVDALFWAACLVLVVAGASKLAAPDQVAPTLAALRLAGPARPGRVRGVGAARLVGAVEVALGIAALVLGGVALALGVAAAYLAFAVVVVLARRRGLGSCGCFGAHSAPPSWVHVAVNVGSAAVAVVAALLDGGPVPAADGLAELGGAGVVVAGLVLLATVLVVVLDTTVADVVEGVRALREQERTAEAT
jgi:hypothetical protein